MRIIKAGKLPEEKVYRRNCHYCGTLFEFKQNEGKITYSQREGDFITTECPFCHKNVHTNM